MITAIAGVSPYYLGGVVSYANQAKTELLGVPPALIEAHGAVSPEVAAAMAEGVRESARGRPGPIDHRCRRSLRRNAGEARRTRLSRSGNVERHADSPARHRVGSAARHHPAPFVQGRPQLGAVDAAGETVSYWAQLVAPPECSLLGAGLMTPPDCLTDRSTCWARVS